MQYRFRLRPPGGGRAEGDRLRRPGRRKKVMALAQKREIDATLVTELSRWGHSTQDLRQRFGVVCRCG